MRLMLLPVLALTGCSASPVVNNDEIVWTENSPVTADDHMTVPPPDANYVAQPDDGGQTDGKPGICDFDGWSVDKDPNGLNVRAAPSADAAIVGTLPPPTFDKDFYREWASDFDVFESRNGWFRIGNAGNEGDTGTRKFPSGWIHGSKLGFELQSNVAFSEPDPKSKPVVTDWVDKGPNGASHRFTFRNPTECKGHWVKLSVTGHDRIERQAWVRGICGIQETTCDGGAHETHGDMIDQDKLPRY